MYALGIVTNHELNKEFRESPELATARRLYQHRLATPEPFKESDEYAIAVQQFNRGRSYWQIAKKPLYVVLGIWGSCLVLCGAGLDAFCPGTHLKTLLKQGEPHPGHSFVNPVRNGLGK